MKTAFLTFVFLATAGCGLADNNIGKGPAGADGRDGIQGLMGSQGLTGERGYTGLQGAQGEQGTPGIDAPSPIVWADATGTLALEGPELRYIDPINGLIWAVNPDTARLYGTRVLDTFYETADCTGETWINGLHGDGVGPRVAVDVPGFGGHFARPDSLVVSTVSILSARLDSEYCEPFDQLGRPNMLALSDLDAYPVMFFAPDFGWQPPLHQER